MDDELIMYTLAELMAEVRWTVTGDEEDNTRRFISVERRIKLFSDVPAKLQPWIGQAEHGVFEDQVSGMPYKTVMEANWFIMHPTPKPTMGSVINNCILRGVRDTLAPKPSDRGWPKRNTLGGLVHHCYIGGRVFKDPGDLDDQALMIVPIKVLVP